jgi:hypothetical protein
MSDGSAFHYQPMQKNENEHEKLTIHSALEEGYFVTGRPHVDLVTSVLFAGSLEDCLNFIRWHIKSKQ